VLNLHEMSLFVTSLNSGSNGNCYYVGNDHEAVLIDAGISCRETERRMRRLGLSLEKVKAIFISHEHIDHIKGLEVLSKRYQLPVYITPGTLQYGRLILDPVLIRTFSASEPIAIGGLTVHGFPKLHDAFDPHSFMVSYRGINVGVFTDIGAPCHNLIHYFAQCHAAVLEANYDDDMLQNGRYPYHLKKRISGDKGHLSNAQALELFLAHRLPCMSHVFLAHLSKENNSPELAQALFQQHAGNTQVIVASRFNETDVYRIDGSVGVQEVAAQAPRHAVQVSLF
jgi:phosphoribosyl 1,2-cyclic phosphodiesterase